MRFLRSWIHLECEFFRLRTGFVSNRSTNHSSTNFLSAFYCFIIADITFLINFGNCCPVFAGTTFLRHTAHSSQLVPKIWDWTQYKTRIFGWCYFVQWSRFRFSFSWLRFSRTTGWLRWVQIRIRRRTNGCILWINNWAQYLGHN